MLILDEFFDYKATELLLDFEKPPKSMAYEKEAEKLREEMQLKFNEQELDESV
jgi:hypothetical protein